MNMKYKHVIILYVVVALITVILYIQSISSDFLFEYHSVRFCVPYLLVELVFRGHVRPLYTNQHGLLLEALFEAITIKELKITMMANLR